MKSDKLPQVLSAAIEQAEVLRRRFRHCAARSLMILREYMGHRARVGRQQVSSQILINAVRRISPDFCILKEARREVLEDLMDLPSTADVLKLIETGSIKVKRLTAAMPSSFAFNVVLESHTDVMRIEDKMEFLKRMHQRILEKIGEKGAKAIDSASAASETASA